MNYNARKRGSSLWREALINTSVPITHTPRAGVHSRAATLARRRARARAFDARAHRTRRLHAVYTS